MGTQSSSTAVQGACSGRSVKMYCVSQKGVLYNYLFEEQGTSDGSERVGMRALLGGAVEPNLSLSQNTPII